MSPFMCWLEKWQDLVAGLIGAAAVIMTVRWTLLAERRRHEEEAKALRTALGAEVRQFGSHAGRGREVCRRIRIESVAAAINLLPPQRSHGVLAR
jgi:hypothetical protein